MAIRGIESDRAVNERKEQVSQRKGISFRAVLIGLPFVAIVCFVVCYAELVIGRIQIGFLQMPPVAIGTFFFLVLLSRWMQRTRRWLSLSAAELLMIYCMMVVAAMVSSRGILEKIIPLLVTANYFANQSNNWQELFCRHYKKWTVAYDPTGPLQQPSAKRFFEGLRAGETIPWGDWVVPLAAWGVLVFLVIFAFLCLATILRRQWVDNEKLSFPLVQLPIGLVQDAGQRSLLKEKLLWAGVLLPTVVFTLNGLSTWFPAIPSFRLSQGLNQYLTTRPWSEMYFTPVYLSFAAIGFFFLLPSDLMFSIWFFAIFARLQGVVAAAYGMEIRPMPMYGSQLFVAYQTVGAYIVLSAYLFYVAIPHLKRVLRAALGGGKGDDEQELMPYRVAVWGLLAAFALIIGWSCAAGMSAWLAILEFGVFLFIVAIVMARSTAEAGMLMTETTFRPTDLYAMFVPLHNLGSTNIAVLTLFDSAFMRDQRGLLLTGMLDGLKISDGANVRRRSLLAVFIIGILAALALAGYLHLKIPYTRGGITLYYYVYQDSSLRALKHYQGAALNVEPPFWQAPVFFFVGIVVTAFLAYMRAMFYWWPLHPLGYALCVSWTSTVFWFSCMIAWLIKVMVLRYGGMRLYIRARPWFLGMILGEFGMAVIWAIIGAITGAPTPDFPWP